MVLLALMVVACATPSRATQESEGQVDCTKLASVGVKTCPPADLRLADPKLANDTGGQVSDKEFKRLVNAFLRTDAYETFARTTNQPALLNAGILSTRHATHLTFGGDLQELAQATSQGGQLGGYGPVLTSLRLVVLPSSIKQAISGAGYTPTRLGWIATYSAPVSEYIVAGSRFSVLLSVSGRARPVQHLKWGSLQSNTPLGTVWRYDGSTQCLTNPLWQAFCESS